MAGDPINSVTVILPTAVIGLEQIHECQIRPIQEATLYAIANRFLRLDFPPQRNYELCLRLIQKGLLQPQFSRQHLQTLPLKTVEQLAQIIFQVSSQVKLHAEPCAIDFLLSLIITVEETEIFDLQALVSEDLALLEAHQKGSLHNYYFKPTQDHQILSQVLQAQGYRCDLFECFSETSDPNKTYWLSRRLSLLYPWRDLLLQYSANQDESFPYLCRLSKILTFLESEEFDKVEMANPYLLEKNIPKIQAWIRDIFPRFSQEANVPQPIREMVLAEGSTEELLIPAISKALGYNLDYEGILIQPVGGKNQMLQQYINYAEHLAVPISIVMDKDAQPLLPDLSFYQREQDHIFILEEGEFEDIYTLELIAKTINTSYQPNHPVTLKELRAIEAPNRVKMLQMLWQSLGLGIFDKVEFAQKLVETLTHQQKLLSPPMKQLVEKIMQAKAHATPPLSC